MKNTIVLFYKEPESRKIYFGILGSTLEIEYNQKDLLKFANENNFKIHWEFEDALRSTKQPACLLEVQNNPLSRETSLKGVISSSEKPQWLLFREAASILNKGSYKRILQLAVQFLATGPSDNSVMAAEVTEELINKIKQKE